LTNRPSFDRKYIFSELDRLSQTITNHIAIFVIGGLALINYELKDATKDIDVVVLSHQDLNSLAHSLTTENYHSIENFMLTKPYEEMEISKIMENSDGFRWDIFQKTICGKLIFSVNMVSRSTVFYTKNKFELRLASKEDIFLFKGITEREADLDDMRLLAETGLNWKVIKDECAYQTDSTGRLWEDALLQNLIDLRKTYRIRSPIEKELRNICVEKMGQNAVLASIRKGNVTIKNISQDSKLPSSFVREITENMERKGLVVINRKYRPYNFSLSVPKNS
jgi:uncharacterized protein (DUF486 family)